MLNSFEQQEHDMEDMQDAPPSPQQQEEHLLGEPASKEKGLAEVLQEVAQDKSEAAANPTLARTEKSPLSAPSSKKTMSSKTGADGKKPSVKQALDTISKAADDVSSNGKAKITPDKTFSPPTPKGR